MHIYPRYDVWCVGMMSDIKIRRTFMSRCGALKFRPMEWGICDDGIQTTHRAWAKYPALGWIRLVSVVTRLVISLAPLFAPPPFSPSLSLYSLSSRTVHLLYKNVRLFANFLWEWVALPGVQLGDHPGTFWNRLLRSRDPFPSNWVPWP